MNKDRIVDRELVSALVDGQLRGQEFARVVSSLGDSPDAVATWHSYHLVGDALRGVDLVGCDHGEAFVARLRARLAESTPDRPVPAPVATAAASGAPAIALEPRGEQPIGANDAVVRWKFLAALASVAALAVVGWHLAGGGAPGQDRAAQLASVPAPGAAAQYGASTGAEPPVMLRDAHLDQLLAAHKQFGGTSALQAPAGFLRNATFENPAR